MILTREKYFKADDFCLSFSEKHSYCEKRLKHLLSCPFREVSNDEFQELVEEEKRLKAIINALTEYKERLGLIDDKGVILVDG